MKHQQRWMALGLAGVLGLSGVTLAQDAAVQIAPRRTVVRSVLASSAVPRLGIAAESMPGALAAQLGLPEGVGLVVSRVAEGVDHGFKQHDVLHKMGDQVLTNVDQLRKLLDTHDKGAKITFTVIRAGKPVEVTVTLPEKVERRVAFGEAPAMVRVPFLGVASEPVSPQVAAQLGLEEGTGVVAVAVIDDSPAAKAGLRRHDILLKVDGEAVGHPDELRRRIRESKAGQKVTLEVLREGKTITLEAELVEKDVVENPGGVIGRDRMFLIPPGHDLFDGEDPFEMQMNEMMLRMGPELERMREQMRQFMLERRDGVPVFPDFEGGPMDMRIEIPEGIAAGGVSVSTFADGTHVITLTRKGGEATLEVKDAAGEVIFNGPWNTEEDKAKLPQELRAKVEAMRQPMEMRLRLRPGSPQPKARPGDMMV